MICSAGLQHQRPGSRGSASKQIESTVAAAACLRRQLHAPPVEANNHSACYSCSCFVTTSVTLHKPQSNDCCCSSYRAAGACAEGPSAPPKHAPRDMHVTHNADRLPRHPVEAASSDTARRRPTRRLAPPPLCSRPPCPVFSSSGRRTSLCTWPRSWEKTMRRGYPLQYTAASMQSRREVRKKKICICWGLLTSHVLLLQLPHAPWPHLHCFQRPMP